MNMGSNTTSGSGNTATGWVEMPKLDNFMDFLTLSCSGAVILGGLVPYIPQYLKIRRSSSSEGFSTYVCLTLLLANILRIAFWFGHRFELPLLFQSFVMIIGMLIMMEVCVRVRNYNAPYIIGLRSTKTRTGRFSLIASNLTSSSSTSSSSSSSSPTHDVILSAPLEASPSSLSSSKSQVTPYHQQDSIEIECERNKGFNQAVVHSNSATQHSINSSGTNSFSDSQTFVSNNNNNNNNISESANSQQLQSTQQQQPTNGTEPQPAGLHSYSNGYISNKRRHRLALVKWLNSSHFWDWDDLFSYVKFLLLFTVILGWITYLLLDNHLYIETLGFVAVFTESMLGVPQLVRNSVKKSTRGMSVEMVIMWLSGDLFKTLYFILRKTPAQFIVCGAIQVTVDVLILIQVFWYRRPRSAYSKLPKST